MRTSLRLVAVGDIHATKDSAGALHATFAQMAEAGDCILLAGDLTDLGLVDEAKILARELAPALKVPVIAVLGNHDYESGKVDEVRHILEDVGVRILDGDGVVIDGVGIVGVKGFGGGFGRRMLEPWGEKSIKAFVKEAMDETLKLEKALSRMRTKQRIALLHYSPIEATVVGEPPEIFAFLGSGRLEDPLNRYGATAVFHGHAHRGALEGKTREGVPVYNVAAPLLRRARPGQPPFRVLEVAIPETEGLAAQTPPPV